MRLISGSADEHGSERRAVVIGASLAGMAAAAALAHHLDHVTVIERDRLPHGPVWRRGVAQSRHAHNLMAAGHRGLERLLPGITRELDTHGMVTVRMPQDMLMFGPGGWIPRFDSDLTMLTGSRDTLDSVLRARLRDHPKVTFMEQTEAVSLRAGRDDTVSGVWVRRREPDSETGWTRPEILPAGFVVDAAGRKSRAPQWLEELGYGTAPETVVDARTAYATTVFAPPLGHVADWKCMLILATPDTPRQGILNPIEGGKWMVSLSASGGERPPTDHAGFLEYAKTLRSPVLHEAIEHATPLGPVHGSGRTENRWHHYEKMRRWPDGFLVLGDAAAGFNPSYGQGMSVAVQCALLLDDALGRHGTTRALTYGLRRAQARHILAAWQIATGVDLQYPWAAEPCPPDLVTRLSQRYISRIAATAPTNPTAARVLLELTQLTAAPTAVFRPGVIAAAVRGPRGQAPTAPPSTTHGANATRARRTTTTGTAPADPAPTTQHPSVTGG
ncbi:MULTISPECIES: FAD-dependent oxidoreductase [unclassified Streptomyces]|uniref:FAD-dependent oxidoreductase n=1 Tax=unclassified Streptomyces TaxID=2593676 RepID=UPI002E29210D|nr:FAD-dependent monooxygenase [Streptomyces sp. NBC_00223]